VGTAYEDLPKDEVLGLPHSWGLLDPNLGTLSRVTTAHVAAAAATVTLGEALPLNLPLSEIDPPLFGRAQWEHSVHALDRNYFEDVLTSYNPQCSSQWDGFRHVRARERGFYGGITDLSVAGDALGIEHIARNGIVGRGVLLDVAGWAERRGVPYDALSGDVIEASTLLSVAADQGVNLRPGDILCVRTGYLAAYRELDAEQRGSDLVWRRFTGLRADEDMARFLWDSGVAALAADNPAVESAPGDPADGSLHRRLLPMLGFVVGELLDFDGLASRCASIGRYEFLFVAVPLNVPGGLSSPANALAVL
jgi:kynurenine formamidase